jgi:hypothetical protein
MTGRADQAELRRAVAAYGSRKEPGTDAEADFREGKARTRAVLVDLQRTQPELTLNDIHAEVEAEFVARGERPIRPAAAPAPGVQRKP